MDEKNKNTFFRDEYNNYIGREVMFVLIVGFLLLMLLLIVFVIQAHCEVQAFNNIHGTNFTLGEWFWAGEVIKDYHLGEVENLNVDLNLRKLDWDQVND